MDITRSATRADQLGLPHSSLACLLNRKNEWRLTRRSAVQGLAELRLRLVRLKRKAERTLTVEALRQRLSQLEVGTPVEGHQQLLRWLEADGRRLRAEAEAMELQYEKNEQSHKATWRSYVVEQRRFACR